MKDLNWLEMLNRLYIVAWVIFAIAATISGYLAGFGEIKPEPAIEIGPSGVIAPQATPFDWGSVPMNAGILVGSLAYGIIVPYILRSVVRWVYAGLKSKKAD